MKHFRFTVIPTGYNKKTMSDLAAWIIDTIDNLLILRYEAVEALQFGCVPCTTEEEPSPFSVEPKSG
jgi:hypothetical protein